MWFGFLVALFIGGFVGVEVGQFYDLPVIISMLAGAVVGGLSWKPRETAEALLQATKESIHFINSVDYKEVGRITRHIASELLDLMVFLANVISTAISYTFGAIIVLSTFLPQTSGWIKRGLSLEDPSLVTVFWITIFSGWVVFTMYAFMLPPPFGKKRFGSRTFLENCFEQAKKMHEIIPIGVPAFFGFVVALLTPVLCIWGTVTTAIALAWHIVTKIPTIALRFIELIATEQRLTVMASCAIGVFWGSVYGSPLLGGFSSMAIGAFASVASRYVIRARRLA